MRKLLTAGIFGTILGIVGAGTTNASIVSSGFLDEKLTEYALSTSLDLKANQKDLTALNDIVGKENWHIVLNLKNKDFPHLSELFPDLAPDKGMPFTDIPSYIYGNLTHIGAPNLASVTDKFLHGWTNSDGETYLGLKDLNTKIGDLPTEIPNMVSTWTKYGFVENPGTPIDLPDTIGGMFAMLFNEDTSYNGLSLGNIMGKILMGFDAIGSRIEGLANLTSVYKLVGDSPIVTAVNANTAKIGTLPTEYATVGAALTAIKGIAEDAKAAALAAIPDPKQEGSSGKFVLTVDIVGDNATYHWEKIDREGETTTTE